MYSTRSVLKSSLRLGTAFAAVAAVCLVAPAEAAVSIAPAPSFDGPVHAVAFRGDTVYVGGSFTKAIVGGKQIARQRLAAFDARTGALRAWTPTADGTVRALAVDGATVYAAGEFATISGQNRKAVAGLDATSGALTAFKHTVVGTPAALATGNGRLYVGGRITSVNGVARTNLAAFSTATAAGALDTGWKPTADDWVNSMALHGGKVYLGGSFKKTNGISSTWRLTRVDAVNGALDTTFLPRPESQVYALTADATGIYAAHGGQGGRAIAYTAAGAVRWNRAFDGDAQAITILDGTVYVGGHFDVACTTGNNGTQGVCTDGSVPRVKFAAITQAGELTGWNPAGNGIVGVRYMTASPELGLVAAAGDFTVIDGAAQKRYASFPVSGTTAPEPSSPSPSVSVSPSVSPSVSVSPSASTTAPSPTTPAGAVSFSFDSRTADGSFPEAGGGAPLRPLGANGGAPVVTARGTGSALTFPGPCTGTTCPRLILEATSTSALNPGAGDFAYGASVRVTPEQTTDGENVLQKGYSTSGSHFKLQVDGTPGNPSCAVTSTTGTTIYLAKSTVSVADGGWHTVECRRTGTTFAILVDGQVRGTKAIPAGLTVTNSQPLRVGGKGLTADNDQFRGQLDDLWVDVA